MSLFFSSEVQYTEGNDEVDEEEEGDENGKEGRVEVDEEKGDEPQEQEHGS